MPGGRARHQDDRLCGRRAHRIGFRRARAAASHVGGARSRARFRVCVAAPRYRNLAGLCANPRPAVGLGRLHADLPGDDLQHIAGRKGVYARAVAIPAAYDLESIVSPMLAAALLAFISFHNLFAGTVIGLLIIP